MGLFITSYYYDPLTRTRARKIFERVLLQLAGLEGAQAALITKLYGSRLCRLRAAGQAPRPSHLKLTIEAGLFPPRTLPNSHS